MDKIKNMASNFKDQETGKTGMSGLAAEGKERYTEFNKDKADGKVNWGQELKDGTKDWRAEGKK